MFKAPKTGDTSFFYDNLISGNIGRSIWGSDKRFDPTKIACSASTQFHYEAIIKQICRGQKVALDIGCSTGGFTGILSKYCKPVIGVDLSIKAVGIANAHFVTSEKNNCRAFVADGSTLCFADNTFDVIQMVLAAA